MDDVEAVRDCERLRHVDAAGIAELEADIRSMRSTMAGIIEDMEILEKNLPKSRRGSRIQSAMDSIRRRAETWTT